MTKTSLVVAAVFCVSVCCALPATAQGSETVDPEFYERADEPPGEYIREEPEEPEEPWYSWFWPIGDRVEVKSIKDEYVPFTTEKDRMMTREEVLGTAPPAAFGPDPYADEAITPAGQAKPTVLPDRPALLIEAGNGFLDTGPLDAGFEVPVLGAVWQPRLWAYAINRTAFQTFDNGFSGRPRETEIANRLDLFVNLQLTGTEKILLGLRPTDNNRPDRFTRYTFEGEERGFNDEFGFNVETLFFEGDFGSLFPNLDQAGILPIDYGFTIGRQPVVFQEGILINDTIDAFGIIRNNIPFPGTSNFRVSAMWGWNRLDRNEIIARNENMYGLFVAADAHVSTFNLDMIYVDDRGGNRAPNRGELDGFYVGASAIQRLAALGGISTAFRVNSSFALNEEVQGVVGNGTLLTAELSKTVPGSEDIIYFNSFLGFGNYTQAGREAVVGGPLANTGILFASPSLSTYLAEIDPFVEDDLIGGAIGYQAFWDNKRRNMIFEIAGRQSLRKDGLGVNSLGFGVQYQQAVGQHAQLTLESFYTINENFDDGLGARAEIQIVY